MKAQRNITLSAESFHPLSTVIFGEKFWYLIVMSDRSLEHEGAGMTMNDDGGVADESVVVMALDQNNQWLTLFCIYYLCHW
jgi:hypothetical protein